MQSCCHKGLKFGKFGKRIFSQIDDSNDKDDAAAADKDEDVDEGEDEDDEERDED